MSAFANITLADSASANVVFTPQSNDASGVATWLDNNSVLDAKRKLTMSVTLPKNGSSVVRIKQKVVVPIMDTVNTSLKVGEIIANIDVVIPKLASQTQRLDARAFAKNLLADAVSTAAFTNLESIY